MLLIHDINWVVVLNRQNHGFENIHVPALGDPQSHSVIRLQHQPPAQRHSKVSCQDPQHHRLPHPHRVAAFHGFSPVRGRPFSASRQTLAML